MSWQKLYIETVVATRPLRKFEEQAKLRRMSTAPLPPQLRELDRALFVFAEVAETLYAEEGRNVQATIRQQMSLERKRSSRKSVFLPSVASGKFKVVPESSCKTGVPAPVDYGLGFGASDDEVSRASAIPLPSSLDEGSGNSAVQCAETETKGGERAQSFTATASSSTAAASAKLKITNKWQQLQRSGVRRRRPGVSAQRKSTLSVQWHKLWHSRRCDGVSVVYDFMTLAVLVYVVLSTPIRAVFWQPRHFCAQTALAGDLLDLLNASAANVSLTAATTSVAGTPVSPCQPDEGMLTWFGLDWLLDAVLVLGFGARRYLRRIRGEGPDEIDKQHCSSCSNRRRPLSIQRVQLHLKTVFEIAAHFPIEFVVLILSTWSGTNRFYWFSVCRLTKLLHLVAAPEVLARVDAWILQNPGRVRHCCRDIFCEKTAMLSA